MTPINQPIAEQGRVVSIGDYVRGNIREYGMFIALIAIMVFFQFSTGGVLFRPLNLTNIILQNSFIVIMALGMLLVIVAGHIDLSVGSVVGFIGAIAGVMTVQWHTNYVWRVSSASPWARLSAASGAISSLITRSRPSSSRWPACWSSAA